MFAPPVPPSGSRPASAAGRRPSYAHEPYDLPRSPIPDPRGRTRHDSYSWRPDAGLPPPPSQIDGMTDEIARGLVPSHPAHRDRSRSRSPAPHSPSRYDLEFGGLDEAYGHHHHHSHAPMNSTSKHPKLKLELVLSSNIFEAGGNISGRLEITCSTSQKLRLGEIAVELEGTEELTSRDHAATQLFLYNRTLFQGEHLPPSNAVLPAAPHNGYWTARKGRTTFPFSFRLPSSAPSCVTFSGNAALRYQLKATAQTWWNEEKMVVTSKHEAFVIEKWSDEFEERYLQPVEAIGDTHLFMGGQGAIWLEAGVVEQLFWGGGQMLIRCGIKNNTKRQVAGIKVALARRLIFPVGSAEGIHDHTDKVSLEPRITEIVHEQHFKGHEYEFAPNKEAVCNVAVDIPRDLRTIRKTRLFEIRIFALVSLVLGSFAKDLTVEIPIYVAHTASVQKPAQENLRALHPDPTSGRAIDRPRSAAGHPPHHGGHHPQDHHHHHHHQQQQHHHHPHHGGHHHQHGHLVVDPQMAAVEQMAAERGWSPAPMGALGYAQAPSRPASAAPGMIQLPSSPQPFSMSNAAPGQLEWNPAATAWNASQFLPGGGMPRSMSAAPDIGVANLGRSVSPGPLQGQGFDQYHSQQPQGWQPPQRAYSVSPGPISPPMQQTPQFMGVPAHGRAPTAGSTHLLTEQHRRASLPSPGPPAAAQFAPVEQQPPQMQSPPQEQLARMPEPITIAASAQYVQQQAPAQPNYAPDPSANTSSSFGGAGPMPLAGLATIEEDGESQAGTVKSMAGVATYSNKPKGSPNAGTSVSRNDIEQFEAMAEAEEDEEDVKRKMVQLGMVPDESAFNSSRKAVPEQQQQRAGSQQAQPRRSEIVEVAQHQAAAPANKQSDDAQSLPKPPLPSGKSRVGTARPRASDIFSTAQKAREEGQDAEAAVAALANASPRAEPSSKPFPSPGREASSSSVLTVKPEAPSPSSMRRSSLSQGMGLNALETNLIRSTTPKISSSPSMPVMALANVGRDDDRSGSPLSSPSKGVGSTRSRKESALRAAAAAREAALVEKKQRETEEAERRREQEALRRAEEERTKAEEARRTAERAKAAEAERIRRAEEQRRAQEAEAAAAAAAAERERQRRQREREEMEEQERRRRQREEEEARAAADAEEEERRQSHRRKEAEAEASRRKAHHEAAFSALQGNAPEHRAAAESRHESRRVLGNVAASPETGRASERPLSVSVSPAQGRHADIQQHSALKKEAASRVAGWLSSGSTPNASLLDTPGTPSGSVISMLKRDEPEESRMSFPVRSPSQVRNPLYSSPTSTSKGAAAEMGLPRSSTTANIASSSARPEGAARERTRSYAHAEESLPALSAELRALVDGSDIKPARRAGTALRDHPISRKISTSSQAEPSNENKTNPPPLSQTSIKRDRHTSLPAWPKPGLPNVGSGVRALPGTATLDQSALPVVDKTFVQPRRSADIFSDADREIVVPSRVEKTLSVTAHPEADRTSSASGAGYDARSARGGRGGRVASVTQLWSNIAGDTTPDASSAHDGPSPPPPSGTFKPKPRRTSAVGGAPALDFSSSSGKKVGGGVPRPGAVTAIAATFASQATAAGGAGGGGSRPELLKSGSAPQFLNTSVPQPVFSSGGGGGAVSPSPSASSSTSTSSSTVTSSTATARSSGERRPLPQPSISTRVGVPTSAPRLVRPIPQSPSSSSSLASSTHSLPPAARGEQPQPQPQPTSKISNNLLSNFERRRPIATAEREVMSSKVAVDSTILDALRHRGPPASSTGLENDEVEEGGGLNLPPSSIALSGQIKMSGRGTTKAIGQGKLRDLKAVWGN